MNKVLLVILALCCNLVAKADTQVSITATLGVPFSIYPIDDLGIVARQYPQVTTYYCVRNIGGTTGYTDYRYASYDMSNLGYTCTYIGEYQLSGDESAESAFSISSTSHTQSYKFKSSSITSHYTYYDYVLTPMKTGNYTFSQHVKYFTPVNWTESNYSTADVIITYVISVIQLTSIGIPGSQTLSLGDTYTFSPILAPSGVTTTLTWQSSNPQVATIDNNGTLTTLGLGTTTITCTGSNGVSATCEITVNPVLAESITMSTSNLEITEGERSQLSVSFTPENVTNKNLLWQSDNESVAIVDQTGRVTGIAAGTCNITATTQDGSNKVANCEVKVISDYIYCGKTIAVAGSNGTLAVSLKNSTELTAIQFELDLPDGVTVSEATLTDRKHGHSIDYALLGNGNYQFTVFSSSSKPFIGNDGVLMNVVLSMPAEMEAGDYTLWQKNIELTTTTGHAVYIEDRSSTLTVNDALLGDVNGDTKISITDAVGIVNYILGNVSATFLPEAADVNGDGGISITDAVKIVNIILNQGSGVKEQRKQEMETEREPQ